MTTSRGGTLYFSSDRHGGEGGLDIYRSLPTDDGGRRVENLGRPVNGPHGDDLPFIAPDASYLIFASDRPGGLGARDLYLSFPTSDGWGAPLNLGAPINSEQWDIYPTVSPDGRYLFFTRRDGWEPTDDTDILWVATDFIDRFRRQAPETTLPQTTLRQRHPTHDDLPRLSGRRLHDDAVSGGTPPVWYQTPTASTSPRCKRSPASSTTRKTAFVLRPDDCDHDVRVRFFTPTTEVPSCGHATIAAHYVRATEEHLGESVVVQKIGAGILPVRIRPTHSDYRIEMTQGPPAFEDPLGGETRDRVLSALGLGGRAGRRSMSGPDRIDGALESTRRHSITVSAASARARPSPARCPQRRDRLQWLFRLRADSRGRRVRSRAYVRTGDRHL